MMIYVNNGRSVGYFQTVNYFFQIFDKRTINKSLVKRLDVISLPDDPTVPVTTQKSTATNNWSPLAPLKNTPAVKGITNHTLDIMVLYTNSARIGATSQAGNVIENDPNNPNYALDIENLIQVSIDGLNENYTDSLVGNLTARLVYTQLANFDDTDIQFSTGWTPDSIAGQYLKTRLRESSFVNQLRDTYGADIVVLMANINPQANFLGVAFVQRKVTCGTLNPNHFPVPPSDCQGIHAGFAPHAYAVVDFSVTLSDYVFAHETGHVLGLEHELANAVIPALASFPWSFGMGRKVLLQDDPKFPTYSKRRTIMAYVNACTDFINETGCNRVGVFSNPNLTYTLQISGSPQSVDYGTVGVNENYKTLQLSAPVASEFRQSDIIFVNGFE